ncbi:MAG: hypothetical protein ACE5J3_09970 [Methanosarcinales archaeon]
MIFTKFFHEGYQFLDEITKVHKSGKGIFPSSAFLEIGNLPKCLS